MRFSEDFIEKVRDANNIVDIISQYTQLKPAGSNLMGLCPFPDHREKSPSFSVSASKQLYHCFGCKKSGNIYSFLQQYNGMSFVECVEFLAGRASIALPEIDWNPAQKVKVQKKKDQKKQLLEINNKACEFYQRALTGAPPEVKSYLLSRSLTPELQEKFKIGYAPDSWDSLTNYYLTEAVSLDQAQSLGLVKARQNASGHFDIFRNRLVFPILSPSSDVIGFGARVLSKEDNPKYLNSPESLVFHKGEQLYGLHETAKHLLSEDLCIVVEGYMDLLALYSVGVKNVVANLGTAFTKDHVKLIKRYTPNVLVLFDGDDAGQAAAERALSVLLEGGAYAYGVSIPEKKDPDEYIKNYGAEAFKKLLEGKEDLYFWYLARKLFGYDRTPTSQIKIIDKIYPLLSLVPDRRLRELYLQETAERIGVDVKWARDTMRQMWQKDLQKRNPTNSGDPGPSLEDLGGLDPAEVSEEYSDIRPLDISKAPKPELEVLKLVLSSEKLLQDFLVGNDFAYLTDTSIQEIFKLVRSYYGQEASNFDRLPALVVSRLRDPSVLTQMLDGNLYQDEHLVRKLYSDCVKKLQKDADRHRLKQLRAQIKAGESSEEGLEEYMKLVKNIQS